MGKRLVVYRHILGPQIFSYPGINVGNEIIKYVYLQLGGWGWGSRQSKMRNYPLQLADFQKNKRSQGSRCQDTDNPFKLNPLPTDKLDKHFIFIIAVVSPE